MVPVGSDESGILPVAHINTFYNDNAQQCSLQNTLVIKDVAFCKI